MVAKKKTKSEPVVEVTKPKKVKLAKPDPYPRVVKGTHLTVYTYEDGTTKLEWDDEQLLKEIREACGDVKPKKTKENQEVKKSNNADSRYSQNSYPNNRSLIKNYLSNPKDSNLTKQVDRVKGDFISIYLKYKLSSAMIT